MFSVNNCQTPLFQLALLDNFFVKTKLKTLIFHLIHFICLKCIFCLNQIMQKTLHYVCILYKMSFLFPIFVIIKEIQLALLHFVMIHGIIAFWVPSTSSHTCAVSPKMQDFYIAVKVKAAKGQMWQEKKTAPKLLGVQRVKVLTNIESTLIKSDNNPDSWGCLPPHGCENRDASRLAANGADSANILTWRMDITLPKTTRPHHVGRLTVS